MFFPFRLSGCRLAAYFLLLRHRNWRGFLCSSLRVGTVFLPKTRYPMPFFINVSMVWESSVFGFGFGFTLHPTLNLYFLYISLSSIDFLSLISDVYSWFNLGDED
jgi:hypothetical protein